MYICDNNMIIFETKESQNLENVKTPDSFSDRELSRAVRDAIVGEQNAIKQYEVIADACSNEKIKKVMQDIADEERVHVGELQKVLNMMLDDEKDLIEEGKEEAGEMLFNK